MHVVLLGIDLKLGGPEIQYHLCSTCEEALETVEIVRPEKVLVAETLAGEWLQVAALLPLEVIVITDQTSFTSTRQWTALGASDVWAVDGWIQKLKESLLQEHAEEQEAAESSLPSTLEAAGGLLIAVGSTYPGAGSTHTSFLIAHYLSRSGKKVAIWESGKHPCFSFLEFVIEGEQSSGVRYNYQSLALFKASASSAWIEAIRREYDYIVLDLGHLERESELDIFAKAQLPVLLGSGSEWRAHELITFCRAYARLPQTHWRIALPLAQESSREFIGDCLRGRPVFALPAHPDPFKKQLDSDEILEGLLSPVMAKRPKRGLSRFF
ncbi:hypothetical protein [Paenibacillus graminis]|uniref:hypothetical protein n=1 Tax=Paenibacillus graminis TaxID=189425 RepID=UPI002DBE0CFD|nr:hypothetical protein [Paenibacillus graminis]MEC0167387.1 hypothetical protein [Paenibacillus graminis]